MSIKKSIFILITVSFTVILLFVFKHIPASSVPYIKDHVPIIYTNNEEFVDKGKNKEPLEPNVKIRDNFSVSNNEINYTASQYHNFEKIIDELIVETREN